MPAASWPRFCRSSSIRGISRVTLLTSPGIGASARDGAAGGVVDGRHAALVVQFTHERPESLRGLIRPGRRADREGRAAVGSGRGDPRRRNHNTCRAASTAVRGTRTEPRGEFGLGRQAVPIMIATDPADNRRRRRVRARSGGLGVGAPRDPAMAARPGPRRGGPVGPDLGRQGRHERPDRPGRHARPGPDRPPGRADQRGHGHRAAGSPWSARGPSARASGSSAWPSGPTTSASSRRPPRSARPT